uniref:Retrotransposon gag domain-containing protein n=1 Tax=Tanacetum cinerariifolium TaxID=118510 RepID=A0A6L2LK51_TANCI|nr:hypothetical protein [Tanacetum cinerariifolium]
MLVILPNVPDQDSLNAAAGGNLLERSTQDVLTIIENKSKVRNSRSKLISPQVKACDVNSNSSEIAKLTHAVNQQTNAVTTAMTAILKQFQAKPPPAPVKAVEETCVTCGARRWLEKEPPRSITTWKDLVSKFINEFFPRSRKINLRNEISNFQQRFDESFHEAWDRYKDLLRACPHHNFTKLHQLDTFYNALNPADQDSLNAAAGGNLLERSTQDVLTIIENKSKVRNSRSKPIASQVKACDVNSNSSEIAKLTHAINQQTNAVTAAMTAILKQFQATPPPAPVKAVEETYVTCGATVNYNQGNPGYRPLGLANQIRPPGFAQPNVQNNQNRFGPPQGFNRGNEQSYQAPAPQNQNVHLNELEKVRRMNEANMKAMKTQIDMVKNELRNEMKSSIQTSLSNQTNKIKNMMASLLQINAASTSGSGSLPSNTVANPKGELKAITTRSGLVINGPTVPTPFRSINPEEDEHVEETFTDPDLAEYTIKQEKDEVQIHKFLQMFKQLHINITIADALILMPKYQKMLKALLSNKEKLQELANTPLNENCSAIILKKLPEKLGDPGKFLIPCGFSELKCKALSDLGASTNLMPLSVWKKLGLPELIPTRITLELANRAICTPAGIVGDVFIPVGKFTFPADFVIVDYESDPRVPLILGRPFLRTARALIDVHGEEMIFRDGDKRLTLNMRHDTSSYTNQPQKESINLINVFNNSSEEFLEDLFPYQPSGNPTFSLHPKLTLPEVNNDIFDSEGCNVLSEKLLDLDSTKDPHPPRHDNPLSGSTTYPLLKEFVDELSPEYDDNLQFDIESDLKEIEFLLYQDKDSSLKDSINQKNRAHLADIFVDSIPAMFTDEHTLDYSSPSIFDVYADDFLEVESDVENIYNDPFDSKGEKIKESKLLIDELDLPCDFHPLPEYGSFISQDFSKVDALPSTNNEVLDI